MATGEAGRFSTRSISTHRMSSAAVARLVWSLLSGVLCACTAVELQQASVEPTIVRSAIDLAKEIDAKSDVASPGDDDWFVVEGGVQPAVIVTAPHATKVFRDGEYRFSDGGATAGLAAALHSACGVTAMYTTYRSPSDPNYYDDNAFKRALGELIERLHPVLLIDIHASDPLRPYDVDLGTMNGASLLGNQKLIPQLVGVFKDEGLLSISSNRFAATKNQTITKYASARNVPAIQLELSATRVSPAGGALDAHRYAQTLEALVRFLSANGRCARGMP
jgi:hypothetical protein